MKKLKNFKSYAHQPIGKITWFCPDVDSSNTMLCLKIQTADAVRVSASKIADVTGKITWFCPDADAVKISDGSLQKSRHVNIAYTHTHIIYIYTFIYIYVHTNIHV